MVTNETPQPDVQDRTDAQVASDAEDYLALTKATFKGHLEELPPLHGPISRGLLGQINELITENVARISGAGRMISDKVKDHLWGRVSKTDPKMTKKVSMGRRHWTSIDPMYRTKKATDEFGLYGLAWGLKDTFRHHNKDTGYLEGTAKFYYPGHEEGFDISSQVQYVDMDPKSSNPGRIDGDSFKKLDTSMRMKALSLLGFDADIYMGKFEDDKYMEELETAFINPALIGQHNDLLRGDDPCAYVQFVETLAPTLRGDLAGSPEKGKVAFKNLIKDVEQKAWAIINKSIDALRLAKEENDSWAVKEIFDEFTVAQRFLVMEKLDHETYMWLKSSAWKAAVLKDALQSNPGGETNE